MISNSPPYQIGDYEKNTLNTGQHASMQHQHKVGTYHEEDPIDCHFPCSHKTEGDHMGTESSLED